ncbi:MAG: TolC family protein [Tannerella sp.]|nr:TolC family protein [Tannerella sp.]
MKKKYILAVTVLLKMFTLQAQEPENRIILTLEEAIMLAQLQSVDAAVAINELKTAYWEYRTHLADQLPEVNFTGKLPSYNNSYSRNILSETSSYIQNNWLGVNGEMSINQNIALTGGTVSLKTSLDFTRQLGKKAHNEYMSVPFGITLVQPVFGVNNLKWNRRIEPVRYKRAKAAYIESLEEITVISIQYFFLLLQAREDLAISVQNHENAVKLLDIAIAKRKIGHISENELMQLELSALQAKGTVTEKQLNLNTNMFQLRSFLGLSEQDIIEPVMPESIPSFRMDYNRVLEKAQENNSFAQRIILNQLNANYEVAKAKGNLRNIELFASVGYTGKDTTFEKTYHYLKANQIVEIGINIPLLDWGKRRGKVKVAESNRDVVLSRNRQEQMNFNQHIFLLVEKFNNQAEQLKIAEEADIIAEKRYHTSIETFMIGKINILDLNDAQNSKDNAKLKHIQELHKLWNYFYNIRSITLYDFIADRNLDADFELIIKQ